MSFPSFRQVAYLLGTPPSASALAKAEGITWPPPPTISLRPLLSFVITRQMQVLHLAADQLPTEDPPQPSMDFDAPPELLDGGKTAPTDCTTTTTEGRVALELRQAAQLRNGNAILKRVADYYAENFKGAGSHSQELLTAMTQLAITGSNAFRDWSVDPTLDLTFYLTEQGMPLDAAATASKQIMSDFYAAQQAVRNPDAGIHEDSLRQGLKTSWIAVSGEDDPPDYPVNVTIAPFPQYHLPITVQGQKGPILVTIRYIIASSQNQGTAPTNPSIPPGDEVILYLHGEGSRAEEALDLIPRLFEAGAAAGRSFTVVSFDLPSHGYSTMVPHLSIADMPQMSGGITGGLINTLPFAGSPILDFIEETIVTFVETLMAPFPNPITAVVGGSLGGHMALRLASSQKAWVRNVVAWSPASVWDHTVSSGGITFSLRELADPVAAGRATEPEVVNTRHDFFQNVFCQDTFNPLPYAGEAAALAGVLIAIGWIPIALAELGVPYVEGTILGIPAVPPQPDMWYSDNWQSKSTGMSLKPTAIDDDRRDRREVYNVDFRRWHWRICDEMIGFTFAPLVPNPQVANALVAFTKKPLLLMVGEDDNYPEVHFFPNVSSFAATLPGLGKAWTLAQTGHSIHNERPRFLANQIVQFAPRPVPGTAPDLIAAVPDLGGLKVKGEVASARARQYGFNFAVANTVTGFPEGEVVGQQPDPGSQAPLGSTINVSIGAPGKQ